jgi:DNA-directed RNA polymerase specialized sigma24 family protein
VQRIGRSFDGLRDDFKEAITLHRMVGLSHAELAAHMARPEGAVRSLVYHRLVRLAIEPGDEEAKLNRSSIRACSGTLPRVYHHRHA